jgi:hypothetical protein
VKQLVDAVSYVQDMELELNKAKADWDIFAQTATLAYQWAWKQQRDVLTKVEANQKARRAAEVAEIMFAINLLTVGIGGGLANGIAKKAFEAGAEDLTKQIGADLSKKFIDKMVEVATDKAKEGIKKGDEWLTKYLEHSGSEDAFKPPLCEPDEYATKMMRGITYRYRVLLDLIGALKQEAKNGLSTPGTLAVYTQITQSDFFRKRPDPNIDEGTLKLKTLMVMWISWGWLRDVPYWQRRSVGNFMFDLSEEIDFEEARESMKMCGIPESRISTDFVGISFGNAKEINKLRDMQKDPDAEDRPLKLMNMIGFIDWCNSDDCVHILFRGLRGKQEWIEQIPQLLIMRRAMGPWGRMVQMPS